MTRTAPVITIPDRASIVRYAQLYGGAVFAVDVKIQPLTIPDRSGPGASQPSTPGRPAKDEAPGPELPTVTKTDRAQRVDRMG